MMMKPQVGDYSHCSISLMLAHAAFWRLVAPTNVHQRVNESCKLTVVLRVWQTQRGSGLQGTHLLGGGI
ncbi:hypothetical protein Pyn_09406 [Prunus yedoensis var. nudiflora]|uniref:Uncharacterized protein n=1 Tax=Prunus yedoensis var. nudiflora TaxID=2094558 RepID=A0A314XL31_PRUYE|nr:hypothetical protein Pyn_09406 [Prunus yedoensis var. nudiflora]